MTNEQDVKPLQSVDAQYLQELNTELIYAQKAYMQALNHMRRVYSASEQEYQLNNLNIGFVKIPMKEESGSL